MKQHRTIRFLTGLVCLFLFTIPNVVSACPTCKDGLHADGTAAAYAISILFMMGMPFLIFTCWVVTIYRLRAKVAVTEGMGLPAQVASASSTDPWCETCAT